MISANGGEDTGVDVGHQLRSAELRESILAFVQAYGRPISLSVLQAVLVHVSDPSTGLNADGDLDEDGLGIHLHHVHLPKLDRLGAIEYDATRRIVRP